MSTAGILIIGNEILSAKVRDENAPYLLESLREVGIDVRRVHVIPDVVEEIAREVRTFSEHFRYVFTTGGVGPTHDDVTMDGVALAFGQKLTLHAEMERMLRSAIRNGEPNESQLKMCMLPEDAELISTPDLWFPLVQVRNVFVFPGIPRLLRSKFQALRGQLEGRPMFLTRVYLHCMESDIAARLSELLSEVPGLEIGSYPATQKAEYRTLVTLESHESSTVRQAVDQLLASLPASVLLRVD